MKVQILHGGLGLDNLFFLVDWNNYGIDDHPVSETVYGTPKEWFGCHGWRVIGTENGSDFREVLKTEAELFDEKIFKLMCQMLPILKQ